MLFTLQIIDVETMGRSTVSQPNSSSVSRPATSRADRRALAADSRSGPRNIANRHPDAAAAIPWLCEFRREDIINKTVKMAKARQQQEVRPPSRGGPNISHA